MLVGVVGLIGSGKNTVGDILHEDHNFRKDSFAKSLKDVTAKLFDYDRDALEGATEVSRKWREEVDEKWAELLGFEDFSPRWALQFLGTEVFRENFHKDIWLLTVKNRWIENGRMPTVITDVRFQNEVQFIRENDGKIIFVRRGELPEWFKGAVHGDPNPLWGNTDPYHKDHIHKSEWDWVREVYDVYKCADFEIQNDGTFDDLKEATHKVARKIQGR